MTKRDNPNWRWTADQNAILAAMWLAGERTSLIGARIDRSSIAVMAQASKLNLPRRGQSSLRQSGGRPAGIATARGELPSQAAQWTGVRFEDARVGAEGMLRGLPPINISSQSTTAAVAAGQ